MEGDGQPSRRIRRACGGCGRRSVRSYDLPGTGRVHLYVGYYRRQHQGKELIGDSAAKLHAEARRSTLLWLQASGHVSAKLRPEANSSRHVLFWYDLNGHVTADPTRTSGS